MTISYRSWNQPDISDWKKALMPRQKTYMLLIADGVMITWTKCLKHDKHWGNRYF